MSKPKEYSYMTKDKLMTYTFVALLVITVVSAAMWSQASDQGWNLGVTVAITAIIAVGVAVGVDALLYKLVSDSPLNTMSAAVFGLIVADSYSLGVPGMAQASDIVPKDLLSAPQCFIYVALISLIGLVLFKKLQSLAGRKFVNPAAAAKFIILLPFISSVFLAKDHFATFTSGGLGVPNLAGPIGNTVINGNGLASFTGYLQSCYDLPTATSYSSLEQLMILQKFHGWVGGASSLAVIIVGIALFALARRYIKWRITVAFFVGIALMSLIMGAVYGGDMYVRLIFEVFIGSSIFLAFFMATDPASTPLTNNGQIIFGVALAVLTVLIQTYMNFFGGSLLALIIMNLTSPTLDKIGKLKPTTESKEPKLPKAQAFAPEKVKLYECIRCGACMRVCCHKLSPILVKQAFDKQNFDALMKLNPDYCTGCGHCTFVCPARIDLRKTVLMAKGALRGQ
jgi:Na+-translocating ferredoxin:NAD+ oxidoreductase RnfD subunit/NAD-dependent dihydropyrimidine dehydrogenase PreA subunit